MAKLELTEQLGAELTQHEWRIRGYLEGEFGMDWGFTTVTSLYKHPLIFIKLSGPEDLKLFGIPVTFEALAEYLDHHFGVEVQHMSGELKAIFFFNEKRSREE